MKKWIIRILALLFLGIVLVALSNLLIGILSEPLRAKYLQDKTVNEMYNLIKQSNVDIQKLKFVLGNFGESSIVEQFVLSIFFSSVIILIYKSIVKLLEKIIR